MTSVLSLETHTPVTATSQISRTVMIQQGRVQSSMQPNQVKIHSPPYCRPSLNPSNPCVDLSSSLYSLNSMSSLNRKMEYVVDPVETKLFKARKTTCTYVTRVPESNLNLQPCLIFQNCFLHPQKTACKLVYASNDHEGHN